MKVVNRRIQPTTTTWTADNITATADETAGTTTYVGDEIGTAHTGTAKNAGYGTFVTFTLATKVASTRSIKIQYQSAADGTMTETTVNVAANATTVTVEICFVGQTGFKIVTNTADGISVTGAARIKAVGGTGQTKTGYAFGYLWALRWVNLYGGKLGTGISDSGHNGVGRTRWSSGTSENATYQSGSAWKHQVAAGDNFVLNDGKAVSLAVIKTLNAAGDKDLWSVYNGDHEELIEGEANGKSGAETYGSIALASHAPKFIMMQNEQGTIYAVRVYNVALTQAEINYNHLVDILAYQGGDIEAFLAIPAATRATLAAALAGISIDSDELSGVASYGLASTDYSKLYVGAENGPETTATLKGLFTAFANETGAYDLTAGTWFNKVDANNNATLRDTSTASSWNSALLGGLTLGYRSMDGLKAEISYTTKYLVSVNDGKATRWSGDAYNKVGIDLPAAWADLDNLTVESVSVLYGIDNYPGGTLVNSASEETFRIDMLIDLSMLSLAHDDPIDGGNILRTSVAKTPVWYTLNGRNYAFRDVCKTNNAMAPAGLTSYWTKTTDAEAATVTYAAGYNTVSGVAIDGATYTAEQYASAKASVTPKTSILSLFNRAAHDVYAIRVYDGVLTAEERLYNHFIDLLAFYQVEVPEAATAAELALLAPAHASDAFVYDDNGKGGDYTAVKDSLKASIDKVDMIVNGAPKSDYDKLYAAQENLVALYSAFENDNVSVDLASGKWYNKVAGGAVADLYDASTSDAYEFAAGERGGINISGVTNTNYDSAYRYIGIRLNDSYSELQNFTAETAAVMGSWTDLIDPENPPAKAATGGGAFYHFRTGLLTGFFFANENGSDGGAKLHLQYRATGTFESSNWYMGARPNAIYTMYHKSSDRFVQVNGKTVGYDGVMAGMTEKMVKKYDAEADMVYYGYAEYSYINYFPETYTYDANNKFKCAYTAEEHAARVAEIAAADGQKVGWFSFFNGVNADVYAIRVYNKVLSAAELQNNHLVDLLAFYQIEIPDHLNSAEWAALAIAHNETPFVKADGDDKLSYSATKAKIEATIENSVTVVIDGASESFFAPNGSYTLPATIDGYTLFGWTDGTTSVAPGTTVAVNGAVTYTALAVDTVTVDANAEATVIKGEDNNTYAAIRFNAYINKAQFQAMNAMSGEGTMNLLEMGILIVPKAYVDGADAFTKAALDAWYIEAVGENKIDREYATGAYLDLISAENDAPAFRGETDSALILSGGFADFSNATITNDPDFVAITYFEVDYDKDGETDNVVYGKYDEGNTVSVYETLKAKLGTYEEPTTESAIISVIVDAMAEYKTEG